MRKYEFSMRFDNGVTSFIITYDNDLLSAAERVLCRPVDRNELKPTETGNWIIQDGANLRYCIHDYGEMTKQVSSTFSVQDHKTIPKQDHETISELLKGII